MSLKAILQSLSEQGISVRGDVPSVHLLDTYPASVDTALLPARLISGANEQGNAGDARFVAIGKLERVNYQIEDLFLLQPVMQGVGIGDAEAYLVEYIDAYRELFRQWRDAGQSQAVAESFTMRKGVTEYPAQSGAFFFSVTINLAVSEWYSGA